MILEYSPHLWSVQRVEGGGVDLGLFWSFTVPGSGMFSILPDTTACPSSWVKSMPWCPWGDSMHACRLPGNTLGPVAVAEAEVYPGQGQKCLMSCQFSKCELRIMQIL